MTFNSKICYIFTCVTSYDKKIPVVYNSTVGGTDIL